MKRFLIIWIFFIYSSANAQVSSLEGRNFKAIIKTNVFNFIMIPSIHLEYRIARNSSLQFNFHRGHITFISESDWLNSSLEFRKYFAKRNSDALRGFYLSPGIVYKYDFNDVIFDDLDMFVKNGKPQIGIIGRLGYQFGLSDNFVMDLGMGLVVLSDFHKYKRYLPDAELRLMTGIGYRF